MSRGKIKIKVKREKIRHLKEYFRENLGAPFIIAFMALLLTSAVFLLLGISEVSDRLATIAYFMLIAGVLLQMVSYFLESRRKKVDERESS